MQLRGGSHKAERYILQPAYRVVSLASCVYPMTEMFLSSQRGRQNCCTVRLVNRA